MILINDQVVTIQQIRDYKGTSPVYDQLQKALARIDELGWPISIIWKPGIVKLNVKSGLKEGKKMISFRRVETIKTPDGDMTVRWAENITNTPNGKTYGNQNYIFRKARLLTEDDIEEALFLIGITSILKSGKIVVEDVASANLEIANRRSRKADIDWLIYSPHSTLSEDRIISLAYAWGVGSVGHNKKDLNKIKNDLYDMVTLKEEAGDANFGYDAFVEASMAEDTPEFIECMSIVRQAEEAKTIFWDNRQFTWIIKGSTQADDLPLLPINPAMSAKKRELLAQHIMTDEKKKSMLMSAKKTVFNPDKEKSEFTKEDWKRVTKDVFEASKKEAGISPKTPDGIAIAQLVKFYKKQVVVE